MITTYDGIIQRVSQGYGASRHFLGEMDGDSVTEYLFGSNPEFRRIGWLRAMPSSLPAGVSAVIPLFWHGEGVSGATHVPTRPMILAEMVDMGSIDIGSNVFTDADAFPTRTELGISRQIDGSVVGEVTTVLNATPGSLTITYVDQDGNSAESVGPTAMNGGAVVGAGGLISLNTGDYGVRDLTAVSRSGGTTPSGVIRFWGIIPLGVASHNVSTASADGFAERLVVPGFIWSRLGAGAKVGIFLYSDYYGPQRVMGSAHFVGDS